MRLSERRAKATADALVGSGLAQTALAVDWNLTKAGIDAAVAAGLVAEYKLWSPPEFCAPGRVHGVDLLKDHAAELNLAFTQFVYRHLELTQVED